jgi:hypothetical protein
MRTERRAEELKKGAREGTEATQRDLRTRGASTTGATTGRPDVVVLLNKLRIIQPVITRRPVIQSQRRILPPVVIRPVPDQILSSLDPLARLRTQKQA